VLTLSAFGRLEDTLESVAETSLHRFQDTGRAGESLPAAMVNRE
jgi:hypothetical protein